MVLKCFVNDSEMLFNNFEKLSNDFEMFFNDFFWWFKHQSEQFWVAKNLQKTTKGGRGGGYPLVVFLAGFIARKILRTAA